MKAILTFVLGWLAAGGGALAGSILGNAAGKTGLFIGAVVGGVIGVLIAVLMARRLAWLPQRETAGALLGGMAGFAIAVPLTLANMHSPLVPVASCALAGAGILVGALVARRRVVP